MPALFAALALLAAEPAARPVVQVYGMLGTERTLHAWGRLVTEGARLPLPDDAGVLQPGVALLRAFDTDGVEHRHVLVTVEGVTYSAMTDQGGAWDLMVRGLPVPMVPGAHRYRVEATDATATPAEGTFPVFPPRAVVIISDVDDTVLQTHVTDRSRMLRQVLTTEGADLKPVPGAPDAYARALTAGASGVVWLSGSPRNLHGRLTAFLDAAGLPRGPMFLKVVGDDPPAEQQAYKLRRLEWLARALPDARLVLSGDDGEKDPEIYAELRRRLPGRAVEVVIRSTRGASPTDARFAGAKVVRNWADDPEVLARAVARLR